jgi:hypothetical protein
VKSFKQYVFSNIKWWFTQKVTVLTQASKDAVFKASEDKNFKLDLKYETKNPLLGIHNVLIEQMVIRYYSFLAERWQGEHIFNRCYYYLANHTVSISQSAKSDYSRNHFSP